MIFFEMASCLVFFPLSKLKCSTVKFHISIALLFRKKTKNFIFSLAKLVFGFVYVLHSLFNHKLMSTWWDDEICLFEVNDNLKNYHLSWCDRNLRALHFWTTKKRMHRNWFENSIFKYLLQNQITSNAVRKKGLILPTLATVANYS